MISIDFSQKVKRARISSGQKRTDTYVLAACSCGEQWYVRRDRAAIIQQCQSCATRENGKRGYAATAAKHGTNIALKHTRHYRLNNPSNLERIVTGWLDALGVPYEREYVLYTGTRAFLLDFMVNGGALAIEVNGTYWHERPATMERDSVKAAALAYANIPLLILTEVDVLSGAAHSQLLKALSTRNN